MIEFETMCGETDGPDEGDNIRGDGIVLGIAESGASEGGRKV